MPITPGPWRIRKCPCGHRSCDQHTIANQGSVGFSLADATAISEVPAMIDALSNVIHFMSPGITAHEQFLLDDIQAILTRIDKEN